MSDRGDWSVRAFFALVLVAYTCAFPYNAKINNPNENVRLYTTMAIVEEGTFRLDAMVLRYGWVNDMARVTRQGGEHFYSLKAPAVSYAGVPVYWAFAAIAPVFGHPVPTDESSAEAKAWWMRATTLVLRLVVVQLPCFGFLVWFEGWLRGVTSDVRLRLSAVASVGLGTNYLAYALMFVSHALSAASTFLAFAILTDELGRQRGRGRARRAGLAGLLAGLSTLLEYPGFCLSVALAIYAMFALRSWAARGAFALGAAVDAAALMLFQWRCFGGPLTPGHPLAAEPAFARQAREGFYGIVLPSWRVFWDLSMSPTFGFFTTCWFMALGALAVPLVLARTRADPGARRIRVATIAWSATMLALWIAMSGAVNWRGGWTVGPRYLGAAPPFFAFGAVCGLDALARRGEIAQAVARGLGGGLAIAGACTLGAAALVYNSFPEEIVHPLTEIALPLARQGFVPHHAGELVGWNTPTFFYFVVACAVAAPLLTASWPGSERPPVKVIRIVTTAAACFAGMGPALTGWTIQHPPAPTATLAWFAHRWEPSGRDRIAQLRAKLLADEATRCSWRALAERERAVGWFEEAAEDDARVARGECP